MRIFPHVDSDYKFSIDENFFFLFNKAFQYRITGITNLQINSVVYILAPLPPHTKVEAGSTKVGVLGAKAAKQAKTSTKLVFVTIPSLWSRTFQAKKG